LGGIVLVLANAFFVSIEFALTRLRQYPKEEIEGDKSLSRAWDMTKELEIYLTGCQLGISFTSILFGIVAEPAVTELLRPAVGILGITGGTLSTISVVVGIIIMNLIHKIWGEQAPTYLGVERPKQVARYFATPLYWWVKITKPFILLGDGLAKYTLRLFGVEMTRSWTKEGETESSPASMKGKIVELLKSSDVSEDRREEVVKALEIDEIPVRDIMVPKDEIIFLSENQPLSKNLSLIRSGKSRYPLAGKSDKKFKGVIYTSEMLANIEALSSGKMKLEDLCRPGMKVPSEMPVSELIDRFQNENQELALVTDEGKILGLATLTDAFEAIVGSAEDPLDVEKSR
jgi:CBS domain containing-hemolysin-like protein